MPLNNCKVKLSLKWIENSVLTTAAINADANYNGADSATLKITDAKLYVSVVTLSRGDNEKLAKQLSEGFTRIVYWNKYKVIDNKKLEITCINNEESIRELLVDCLFLRIIILIMMKIVLMLIFSKNISF